MNISKTIVLDVNLKADEFVRFQNYHIRKFNIIYWWFVVLVISLILILLFPSDWIYGVMVGMTSGAVGYLLRRGLVRWRAKRDFNRDYTDRKKYNLIVGEHGIEQTASNSNVFFQWMEVRSAHKNKDMYRLYVARTQAVIIPFSSFASQADQKEFERLIAIHLPAKGNRLSASVLPLVALFFSIGALVIGISAAAGHLLSAVTEPATDIASPIPTREAAFHQKSSPFTVNLPSSRTFSGGDGTWEISEFGVLEKGDGFQITPGTFKMIGMDQYYTDYRKIIVFMTVDRDPFALIESELEQPNIDIANLETGPSGFAYYKDNGRPAKMADIRELYVEIQWRDNVDGDLKISRIELYPIDDPDSKNNGLEQEIENPEVRKGDDLGQFIATSWKSPNLVNIIELREVQIADKDYATRSDAQREARASVRFYYGRNGGILDQFVDYDPGGLFELEDFEVIWQNDWEATINAFAPVGTIDESFDIQLTE